MIHTPRTAHSTNAVNSNGETTGTWLHSRQNGRERAVPGSQIEGEATSLTTGQTNLLDLTLTWYISTPLQPTNGTSADLAAPNATVIVYPLRSRCIVKRETRNGGGGLAGQLIELAYQGQTTTK